MNVWFAELWRAWRASLRRPVFLLLASGVLALGMGASVAVYVLIDSVLLRPLPYPQASYLVALGRQKDGAAWWASPQQYQHMSGMQGVVSLGLIDGFTRSANIAGDGVPELVPMLHIDHGLLPTLGVNPVLGRNFSIEEDRPNGPKVVLLSHGFWMRRYGGRMDIVGHNLSIEGVTHTIIGVLPTDGSLQQGDILLPFALPEDVSDDGTNYRAIARLAPGVKVAAVSAQLDERMHALYAAEGGWVADYMKTKRFVASDLQVAMRVHAKPVLMMFLASAALVLLIAWGNLANLLLLRGLSRYHDMAVRTALGATWGRRVLPLLAEGSLIGLVGSAAGIVLAIFGLHGLQGLIPADWLVGSRLSIEASTVVITMICGVAAALLATALGVFRSMRLVSMDALREGGRTGVGRHGGWLGRVLVVVQVALAGTLLSGAGLFLHALYDAARTPLGFSSDHVLTFELAPVEGKYPDAASVQTLIQRLEERLRGLPGVEQVAATTALPAGDSEQAFYIGGVHAPGAEPIANTPQLRAVSPDFFAAFSMTARQGRVFQSMDRKGGEQVAIINQALADSLYGGDALGKTLIIDADDVGLPQVSARIVGVLDNISPFGPLGTKEGLFYLPMQQMPDALLALYRTVHPLRFVLRVHGNPGSYSKAVTAAVADVAPDQPIANMRSMQHVVYETTAATRLNLLLIGLFAALALLLAAAGLYAVMSVAVAMRVHEFGVRMALGAAPTHLMYSVLRDGLWQMVVGFAIGVGLAFLLAGVMRAVVVQIHHALFDPPVLATTCAVLLMAGLLACLQPAWRAGRVQPMQALRGD
ncbi:ADOP family duplicated permease [Dyella nitratireducens]|uniref:Permease n=1 Tax=Dyella nitratireducens TaxID=1849580 RepID=A0ABQ1GUP3_9GAMM|nr:ADOP family duplicated permease [Dyella nitratireducens]GGA50348.1 hypothetical protein GCM10010981_44590 [Dyella nitratireducens]GLQ42574.1 hypothetical protein GCM10007902_24240 [Dyella nitratireducens]